MDRSPDKLPVLIIEAYKDYRPRTWVRGAVEKLLGTVPSKYLVGLESVVLTNSGGQSRRERRRRFSSRGRRIPSSGVLAFYSPASRTKRPHHPNSRGQGIEISKMVRRVPTAPRSLDRCYSVSRTWPPCPLHPAARTPRRGKRGQRMA